MTYAPDEAPTPYQKMVSAWLEKRARDEVSKPVSSPPHCERKAAEINLGIEEMAEFGLRLAARTPDLAAPEETK